MARAIPSSTPNTRCRFLPQSLQNPANNPLPLLEPGRSRTIGFDSQYAPNPQRYIPANSFWMQILVTKSPRAAIPAVSTARSPTARSSLSRTRSTPGRTVPRVRPTGTMVLQRVITRRRNGEFVYECRRADRRLAGDHDQKLGRGRQLRSVLSRAKSSAAQGGRSDSPRELVTLSELSATLRTRDSPSSASQPALERVMPDVNIERRRRSAVEGLPSAASRRYRKACGANSIEFARSRYSGHQRMPDTRQPDGADPRTQVFCQRTAQYSTRGSHSGWSSCSCPRRRPGRS